MGRRFDPDRAHASRESLHDGIDVGLSYDSDPLFDPINAKAL